MIALLIPYYDTADIYIQMYRIYHTIYTDEKCIMMQNVSFWFKLLVLSKAQIVP